MDERFLIDTNISIYFLEGVLPSQSLPFIRSVFSTKVNVSVITQIELLGWAFPDVNQATITGEFVKQALIYPLDQDVVQQTIVLRRSHRIKLPDAIIAATALVHGLTLISWNDRNFLHVSGLSYRNPFTYIPAS